MTQDQKKEINDILVFFGYQHQKHQALLELSSLNNEIINFSASYKNNQVVDIEKLQLRIAKNLIMIEQLEIIFNSPERIEFRHHQNINELIYEIFEANLKMQGFLFNNIHLNIYPSELQDLIITYKKLLNELSKKFGCQDIKKYVSEKLARTKRRMMAGLYNHVRKEANQEAV